MTSFACPGGMARGLLFAVDVAVGAGGFRREGQDYALGARAASRVTSAPAARRDRAGDGRSNNASRAARRSRSTTRTHDSSDSGHQGAAYRERRAMTAAFARSRPWPPPGGSVRASIRPADAAALPRRGWASRSHSTPLRFSELHELQSYGRRHRLETPWVFPVTLQLAP